MSAIRLFFSFFFIVLLAACGPSAERQAVVLQGKTMGTTYTVKYLSDGLKDLPPPEQVQADLDKLLVEVNRQMSTYDPSSESAASISCRLSASRWKFPLILPSLPPKPSV